MITYRDMTFCVNQQCKQKCDRRLTKQIEQDANGMPIAVADFNINTGCEFYTDEEMS